MVCHTSKFRFTIPGFVWLCAVVVKCCKQEWKRQAEERAFVQPSFASDPWPVSLFVSRAPTTKGPRYVWWSGAALPIDVKHKLFFLKCLSLSCPFRWGSACLCTKIHNSGSGLDLRHSGRLGVPCCSTAWISGARFTRGGDWRRHGLRATGMHLSSCHPFSSLLDFAHAMPKYVTVQSSDLDMCSAMSCDPKEVDTSPPAPWQKRSDGFASDLEHQFSASTSKCVSRVHGFIAFPIIYDFKVFKPNSRMCWRFFPPCIFPHSRNKCPNPGLKGSMLATCMNTGTAADFGPSRCTPNISIAQRSTDCWLMLAPQMSNCHQLSSKQEGFPTMLMLMLMTSNAWRCLI